MTPAPLRILIADDDDGDRMQMRRLLRQAGFQCEVTEAASIEEANLACKNARFDCAIVDYLMPGHDGLHGITSLREQQPDIAIIMVTGQGDEMVASEAIKLGAADYMPKSQLTSLYVDHVLKSALNKVALERKVAEQKADLENFAHVLAHDLKTPIHHVQYLASFIDRDLREGKTEKLRTDCEKIVAVAKRMEDLINTLHQYTRAEANVVFQATDLQEVLEDCLNNMAPTIAACRAAIEAAKLPKVTGNAALLTQLFQNLIANGLKYCSAERPEIKVLAENRGGVWLVGVQDNGIGIAKEHRSRVFEPFKRLHSADQYEGTGLGLATCRKIVQRHGGEIWCDAAESGGTVFWFTLPQSTTVESRV
jgi:light-regulated signal transduction histidine kinase (bacteriophytochrome)